MLSGYAFLIFREVLEIGLLLNLANFNLTNIKNIKQLNVIALFLALLLGSVVAFIMQFSNQYIHESFQEIFDIIILSFSAFCIIYNIIITTRYNFKKIQSTTSSFMIVMLLFSIIFREIIEILIFSYSYFGSKVTNNYLIAFNFAAGSLPAIIISFIFAYSIKNKIHHSKISILFKITNFIMLIIASSFINKALILLSTFFSFDDINLDYLESVVYCVVVFFTCSYLYLKK